MQALEPELELVLVQEPELVLFPEPEQVAELEPVVALELVAVLEPVQDVALVVELVVAVEALVQEPVLVQALEQVQVQVQVLEQEQVLAQVQAQVVAAESVRNLDSNHRHQDIIVHLSRQEKRQNHLIVSVPHYSRLSFDSNTRSVTGVKLPAIAKRNYSYA